MNSITLSEGEVSENARSAAVRRVLLVIAVVSMPGTEEAFCGTTGILAPPDVGAVARGWRLGRR